MPSACGGKFLKWQIDEMTNRYNWKSMKCNFVEMAK